MHHVAAKGVIERLGGLQGVVQRFIERQRPLLYLVAVDPGTYDAVLPIYVTEDDPARLQCTLMVDQVLTPESAASYRRRGALAPDWRNPGWLAACSDSVVPHYLPRSPLSLR